VLPQPAPAQPDQPAPEVHTSPAHHAIQHSYEEHTIYSTPPNSTCARISEAGHSDRDSDVTGQEPVVEASSPGFMDAQGSLHSTQEDQVGDQGAMELLQSAPTVVSETVIVSTDKYSDSSNNFNSSNNKSCKPTMQAAARQLAADCTCRGQIVEAAC